MLRWLFYTELHRVSFEVDSVERVTQSVLLVWFKRVKVKFLRKNCPLEGTLGVLQLWFYRRLTDFKWCYGCDFTPSFTEFLLLVLRWESYTERFTCLSFLTAQFVVLLSIAIDFCPCPCPCSCPCPLNYHYTILQKKTKLWWIEKITNFQAT